MKHAQTVRSPAHGGSASTHGHLGDQHLVMGMCFWGPQMMGYFNVGKSISQNECCLLLLIISSFI